MVLFDTVELPVKFSSCHVVSSHPPIHICWKIEGMVRMFHNYLAEKTTLIFPTSKELWDFFKITEVKEFRLDSAKCSVTGRFTSEEIQLAKEQLNAIVD